MRRSLPLLALCLLAASPVSAADPSLPKPIFTRQTAFSIPYRIDAATDPSQMPVQIELYVSSDLGRSWKLDSSVAPEKRAFVFRTNQDAEYWFRPRTLNRDGQRYPEAGAPPELRVIVDTVSPIVELEAWQGVSGEISARWKIGDPWLDPERVKLDYRVEENKEGWETVAVDQVRHRPEGDKLIGVTTWWPRSPELLALVRVEVSDQAGNRGVMQVRVKGNPKFDPAKAAKAGKSQVSNASVSQQYGSQQSGSQQHFSQQPQGRLWPPDEVSQQSLTEATTEENVAPPPATPNTQPQVASGETVEPPVGRRVPPSVPTSSAGNATTGNGASGNANVAPGVVVHGNPIPDSPDNGAPMIEQVETVAPPPGGSNVASVTPPISTPQISTPPATEQLPPPQATPPARTNSPPTFPAPPRTASLPPGGRTALDMSLLPRGEAVRLVNTRRFELDYDVEAVSGIGLTKVELWGTRDGGQTWSSYAIDTDNQTPLDVTVEGEGIYGFRITVENESGLGSLPPRSGEAPDVWLGVDLTPPFARLVSAEPRSATQAHELVITWEANDERLIEGPVSLSYTSQPGGPWTAIATGLENTGQYVWLLDNRLPVAIYLRLEVRDEAGNVQTVDSRDPVSLESLRPHGRIRDVRPAR